MSVPTRAPGAYTRDSSTFWLDVSTFCGKCWLLVGFSDRNGLGRAEKWRSGNPWSPPRAAAGGVLLMLLTVEAHVGIESKR